METFTKITSESISEARQRLENELIVQTENAGSEDEVFDPYSNFKKLYDSLNDNYIMPNIKFSQIFRIFYEQLSSRGEPLSLLKNYQPENAQEYAQAFDQTDIKILFNMEMTLAIFKELINSNRLLKNSNSKYIDKKQILLNLARASDLGVNVTALQEYSEDKKKFLEQISGNNFAQIYNSFWPHKYHIDNQGKCLMLANKKSL